MGGIPTAEMNSLELEFLFMINFTLNVTPEVYRQYEHELMMRTLSIPYTRALIYSPKSRFDFRNRAALIKRVPTLCFAARRFSRCGCTTGRRLVRCRCCGARAGCTGACSRQRKDGWRWLWRG